MEKRWGVLFQFGALFSSLTVGQNVEIPMREFLDLPGRPRPRSSSRVKRRAGRAEGRRRRETSGRNSPAA